MGNKCCFGQGDHPCKGEVVDVVCNTKVLDWGIVFVMLWLATCG